jgi:hypothetical protein
VPPTSTLAITLLVEDFYPKLAVPEMGKFTQKWYGKKWVKIGNCEYLGLGA